MKKAIAAISQAKACGYNFYNYNFSYNFSANAVELQTSETNPQGSEYLTLGLGDLSLVGSCLFSILYTTAA